MNAVISELIGDSFISIEGKLNKSGFSTLSTLSDKETKNLKRHTLEPLMKKRLSIFSKQASKNRIYYLFLLKHEDNN